MAKLLILLAVFAIVQISCARDVAETLNDSIRGQLNLYDKFLKEPDSAKFAEDLKKLVQLTEEALKSNSAEEKNKIITEIPSKFSPDFNNWISFKIEEAQVNGDIQAAIEFYNSLLPAHAEHQADIRMTLSILENLLKETNLKQKEEKFAALDKNFSDEFQKFLKENALPNINQRLKSTAEFFGNLLNDKDTKFVKEIQTLKTKTEAALGNNVSADEKNQVLLEVSSTDNEELNEYLQRKNIEYS